MSIYLVVYRDPAIADQPKLENFRAGDDEVQVIAHQGATSKNRFKQVHDYTIGPRIIDADQQA